MNDLWEELERVCMILKHAPEQIDPTELRSLLRRTQHTIDVITPFTNPTQLSITQNDDDGYIEHVITVTVNLSTEQKNDYLHLTTDCNQAT